MLALLLVSALARADLTPPPPPPPVDAPYVEPAPQPAPTQLQPTPAPRRSAGLLTEPRVGAGLLVGRVFLGMAGGLGLGGLLGGVTVYFTAALSALSGSLTFVAVGTVFAAAMLATGVALGSAAFGKNYGADFADAFLVSSLCAVIGVGLGVAAVFLAPGAGVIAVPLMILAVGIPLIAPPLLVQAFKRDDAPEPTIALARF